MPRLDLSDDRAEDAVDREILGRVDGRDPAAFSLSASAGGMIPPTTTGIRPRPAARRSRITSPVSATCEPERIDRPTQWTPDLARSTISAGVRRMPS